jgi:hypothetical protein
VGVFIGLRRDEEYALFDVRLDLPRTWDKDRKRCQKARVPEKGRYQARHELAREMLRRHGRVLPHGWVAGDDEMGRPARFRQRLARDGERSLLAGCLIDRPTGRDGRPPVGGSPAEGAGPW